MSGYACDGASTDASTQSVGSAVEELKMNEVWATAFPSAAGGTSGYVTVLLGITARQTGPVGALEFRERMHFLEYLQARAELQQVRRVRGVRQERRRHEGQRRHQGEISFYI